jgi:hypothetical protein
VVCHWSDDWPGWIPARRYAEGIAPLYLFWIEVDPGIGIRQDIDGTVATTTERSRRDIVTIVQTESQRQSEASAHASAQLSDFAAAANRTG